jgi:translation initiation factor IF-1
MVAQDAFQVEGRVIEVLSQRTCRVELSNGHRLLGFIPKAHLGLSPLAVGDKVELRLSPFDLSEGRILARHRSADASSARLAEDGPP